MTELRSREYRHIGISRIAGSLGAEIGGVDLSRDLDEEVLGGIRRALPDHLVIFFRDRKPTPDRRLASTRRWGEIRLHPCMRGMDNYPEAREIRKTLADKKNSSGSWHSDQRLTAKPAMGTIPCAKGAPSAGGDTPF